MGWKCKEGHTVISSGWACPICTEALRAENAKLREALEKIAAPVLNGMVPTPGDDDECDKLLAMNRHRRDLARAALAACTPNAQPSEERKT